jgi:anti-sigma regulatory factor (Ser/Thr protein kinase)
MFLRDRLDTLGSAGSLLRRPRQSLRHAILALPAQEASVPAARHFTDDLLRSWGIVADERYSAQLIVDELAANAVQHGRSEMTLLLILGRDELVLAVADSGAAVTHRNPRAEAPADEHGRGLGIVEFVASWTDVHDSLRGRLVRVGLRVNGGDLAEPDDEPCVSPDELRPSSSRRPPGESQGQGRVLDLVQR